MKRRAQQFEKRHKREGLLREVFTPEDRILLSGITVSDDTVVVEHKNAAVAIDVLANDSTNAGANLYVLSASQGSYGTVSLVVNAQGEQRLLYTADTNFVGTDSFTYYAMDDFGQSSTGTVTFTIDLPEAGSSTSSGLVPSVQLSNGFTPDGHEEFDRVVRGNFEMIVGGTNVETDWIVNSDGSQRGITTTTTRTYSIVSTESPSGAWNYNETLVGTSSTLINAGGGSIAVGSTENFGFTFGANGNATTTSYLMNVTGTGQGDGVAGSATGSPSAGSGILTGFESQGTYSASIQNSTNLATGASTGSVTGSGTTTYTKTETGTFQYQIDDGINGATSLTTTGGNSWNYTGTTGTITDWSKEDWAFNGTGTYQYNDGGVSDSGTNTVNGSGSDTVSRSITSTLTGNGWSITGGTLTLLGNSQSTVSKNGSYSSVEESGSYEQSVVSIGNYNNTGNIQFGTDGQVLSISGGGLTNNSVTVTVGGSFVSNGNGQSSSGSYSSQETATSAAQGNWSYVVLSSGALQLVSASQTITNGGNGTSEYEVDGFYNGVGESGIFEASGESSGNGTGTTTVTYASGTWSGSSNGNGTGSSSSFYASTYNKLETTSTGFSSQSLTIESETSSDDDVSWNSTYEEDSNGELVLTKSRQNVQTGGSATFTYNGSYLSNETVGDTFNGRSGTYSGSDEQSFDYEVTDIYANGVWSSSILGGADGRAIDQFSDTASTTTTTSTGEDSQSMTVEGGSDTLYEVIFNAAFSEDAEGNWTLISMGETNTGNGTSTYSYEGTWDSDHTVDGTTTTSSTDISGDSEESFHYTVGLNYSQSQWSQNGNGGSTGNSLDTFLATNGTETTHATGSSEDSITVEGDSSTEFETTWSFSYAENSDGLMELVSASDSVSGEGSGGSSYSGLRSSNNDSDGTTTNEDLTFEGISTESYTFSSSFVFASGAWSGVDEGTAEGGSTDEFIYDSSRNSTLEHGSSDDRFHADGDSTSSYEANWNSEYEEDANGTLILVYSRSEFDGMSNDTSNYDGESNWDYSHEGNTSNRTMTFDGSRTDLATFGGSSTFTGGAWTSEESGTASGLDSSSYDIENSSASTFEGGNTDYTFLADGSSDVNYEATWSSAYGAAGLTSASESFTVTGGDVSTFSISSGYDYSADGSTSNSDYTATGETESTYEDTSTRGFSSGIWTNTTDGSFLTETSTGYMIDADSSYTGDGSSYSNSNTSTGSSYDSLEVSWDGESSSGNNTNSGTYTVITEYGYISSGTGGYTANGSYSSTGASASSNMTSSMNYLSIGGSLDTTTTSWNGESTTVHSFGGSSSTDTFSYQANGGSSSNYAYHDIYTGSSVGNSSDTWSNSGSGTSNTNTSHLLTTTDGSTVGTTSNMYQSQTQNQYSGNGNSSGSSSGYSSSSSYNYQGGSSSNAIGNFSVSFSAGGGVTNSWSHSSNDSSNNSGGYSSSWSWLNPSTGQNESGSDSYSWSDSYSNSYSDSGSSSSGGSGGGTGGSGGSLAGGWTDYGTGVSAPGSGGGGSGPSAPATGGSGDVTRGDGLPDNGPSGNGPASNGPGEGEAGSDEGSGGYSWADDGGGDGNTEEGGTQEAPATVRGGNLPHYHERTYVEWAGQWAGAIGGGIWYYPQNVGLTLYGYFIEAPSEMVTGVWTIVSDLPGFVSNLEALATKLGTNPGELFEAILDEIKDKASTPNGQGALAFELVTTILTGGSVGSLKQGGKLAKLLEKAKKLGGKKLDVGPAPSSGGLFRNKINVGEFADLPVTMNLKTVRRMAKEAEIGFSGIKLNIVRDPSLKGRGVFGYAHPNGKQIDLYPDAFSSPETLIRTLGHERTHSYQFKIFGPARDSVMSGRFEDAAYGIEDAFLQHWLRSR